MKKTFLSFLLSTFICLLGWAQTPTLVWSTLTDSMTNFSSPHLIDLNNDGILDIVMGGGSDGERRTNSMSAFDGVTGQRLWGIYGWNQIFGSANFMDITNDGTPDAFIGGRRGQLNAINGATGNFVWQFFPEGDTTNSQNYGIYNFYNPQIIPDQNDNGTPDILVANGGNHDIPSFDTLSRPIGNLMIIEGSTGELIVQAQVPDGREIYHSVVVHDFGNGLEVIYGTGGETKSGYLYRVPLATVLSGDLSTSTSIAFGTKGFIAPVTLADVTLDGVDDIIASAFDARTYVIDGATNQLLWQHKLPGTETSAAPTLGRFTPDYSPDVFITVGVGLAPSYTKFIQLAYNGLTGEIIFQDTLGIFQYSTGLAVDLNGDFRDEIITGVNIADAGVFKCNLLAIDIAHQTQWSLNGGGQPGTNLASTPWVGDIDDDGILDLVYTHNRNANTFQEPPATQTGFYTERWNLHRPVPNQIGFGAYMGNNYDGKYLNPFAQCVPFTATVTANSPSCFDDNNGSISFHAYNGTSLYSYTVDTVAYPPISSAIFIKNGLSAGNYPVAVIDNNGCFFADTVTIVQPTAIATTATIAQPTQANNGSFTVIASGGTPPYVYAWAGQTASANNTANNLAAGSYVVTTTDANNCTSTLVISLFAVGLDATILQGVQIAPNPTHNFINIQAQTSLNGQLNISNVWGQKVLVQTINGTQTSVNVSALPKGMYIVEVLAEGKTYREKIVVE